MSSFRDLVKKVNAEKNAGTSERKSSSFRDLVKKVNDGTIKVPSRLNSSQVNDWYKGVKTFSDMGYKYLTKEGYKTPNTNILTSLDGYLSQADEVGHYIRTNRDAFEDYEKAIQDHYDTVSYLRSLKSGIESSNKFYSDFKDEADYNFWDDHSTVENRQEWYQGQQSKIDELGEVYDNYHTIDLWYQDYQERPWAYTEEEAAEKLAIYEKHKAYKQQYGSDKDILDAIDVAKAEMENYKRGNYNENGRFYGSKVVDDNYAVTQREDFGITSANRDYKNPTKDEFTQYDVYNDSSTWYFDANGVYRDAYGDELVVDESGNWVNPKTQGFKVEDKLGLYLNTPEEERDEAAGLAQNDESSWASVIKDGIDGSWKYLKDTEIGIYYTYLGESQEKAYQFLSDMKTELNRRQTLDEIGQWHEGYEDANFLEKIAMSAATIPAKFVSNIAGSVENAVNTLMGNDINPYSAAHSGMHYSQTIRGDRAKEFNNTVLIPGIDFTLGDLYQVGMSRMDSALATGIFGGGGTVFLGMGAAQEEAYKLYQQGASAEQITLDAFAAGAAEAVWEYISFGKLEELGRVKNPGQWVKNVLIQGWNEAFEEAGTEVTNIITNALIMGSQSDLAELYKENEESAFWTFADILKQTLHSAIGGFAGGAMAGGVQGGQSYIDSQKQYAAAGEKINDSVGGVDALKKLANEVAGVSDPKMQKSLNNQIASVEKKASNRKVGRLYESLGNAYNAQNKADIVTILEMNKFSSETASAIADAVVGLASGNLTEQQAKVLEMYKDNEDVKGVIAGYDLDERSSIGKRNLAMANFEYGVAFSAQAKKHADKVFTPEGKFAVSSDGEAKALVTENVDGKTITKDTGEVIDIKGIASIRKGEMLLDIGNGKTINAKNVAYANKKDALIYESIANLGGNIDAETANRLISKFDGGDAMVFARGIAQAYTYGFYGLDRSEMKGKNTLASELTEEQRNFAYGLGEKYRPVKDAADKATAKVTRTPGEKGVYYRDKNGNATDIRTYLKDTEIGLKDVQKTAIEVMEKMSEMLGVRFNVFESWVENGTRYYLDENGDVIEGNPNGFYDTTTGEIYIDLNAGQDYQGTMLFTVAHELTHFMRQWSPEQFTKIANIVFKHGGMKGSVAKLAAVKQAKAKAKGKPISYDTALEEVVADGMETILKDGKVLEFMEDVKKTDHEAWAKLKEWFQKLGEFLKKLVDAYGGRTAHTVEGRKVAEFADDLLTQIKQLYAEGAVTAGERYQMAIGNVKVSNQITMEEDVIDSSNTGISKEAKTGVKMQERTEYEAMPKQVFRVSTTNGEAESNMLDTNKSVKELRDANFKKNGFTDEEITKMNGFIKEMADNMAKYRLKYKFVGLQNIHDAKIILNPMTGKIVLSAMVNNSDYSVNFDFTKICKKRVALQEVLETLAREKGKVTDGKVTEVNLSPSNIKHINDILASYGVETACLCCFVESKRYNIQNYYQEKVVDVWNALVDEVAPDAGYFNFADSDVDTSKIPDSEFAELEKQMNDWANKTGKARNVEQKMREFLADSPAARKKLRFSDLVTANGRTNLHKLYPEIESLILSKLGQSAPKSVEAFTPYNGEIDLLEAKSDGDIIKYLYSIAGVRSQSFSDFMIAHVFDVLQKTASMSARKMPAHVYTKEIARAMLFGMTGEKHNMSVLHNVDPNVDSWSAGLSADGEYNFSDYEAYKKGYSEFVQSIGWKDAVTLQNTEGYSKDCGIIGVGFSYNHMLKLHNDPEVRQVIGYHTSQMPVEVKPLTHLDKAADYTDVQNTKAFVGFAKPNYAIPEGVPSYATPPQDVMPKGNKKKTPKTTAVSDTFDIVGTFNKLSKGKTGDARTAAAKETLRQLLEYANDHGYCIKVAPGEAGKGEFDLYGDVQKTQNPYLTTDHYIEYCIERGMLPMFFEFSMNPNYYKDVFDFNVFDRKSYNPETGLHEDTEGRKAYAPQTAVHMLNEDGSLAFPENFFDIVDKQMNSYNGYMQDVESKMPSIMDEVRAVTNSTTLMSDRDQDGDTKVLNVRFSERETLEQAADSLAKIGDEDYLKAKEEHPFIIVMDHTPEIVLKSMEGDGKATNRKIIIRRDALYLAIREEGVQPGNYHGLGEEVLKKLPEYLEHPDAILKTDGNTKKRLVLVSIPTKSGQAIISVEFESAKDFDGKNEFFNVIVTVFDLHENYLKGLFKKHSAEIKYEKEDLVQVNPQLHKWLRTFNTKPSTDKVTQPDPEVKKNSDRDSDGNQLSKEQQAFFRDSVVRDADGNLMVMYHGTANGGAFTVFDGDKLGNDTRTTQVGQGFYFTNMRKEAESYMKNVDIYGRVTRGSNPHLHQAYLNITKPFDINTDTLDIDKVKSVYMDGTRDYFFNEWIPFYLDKRTVNGRTFTKAELQAMSKADKVSVYVEYLSMLGTKEVLSNMVRAFPYGKQSELLAAMKNRLGYDGIVEEFKPGQYQYVAFSSEQIKNVDNQNPTANPDIRYSDRDDAPIFYSQMAKVVDGLKDGKYGAASLLNTMRNRGVKAEEIKWSGIEEWLDGKKSVTKAELQEFIAGSMLQIEEEVLTNEERPYSEEHQKLLDEYTTERDKIGETLAAEWKRITGEEFPIRNLGAGVGADVDSKIRDINLEYKKSTFEGRLLDKLRKDLKEVIANNDDFGFDSWKEALVSIHRNRKNFVTHYEMSTNDKAVIVKYCNALSAYNDMPNKISDADTDTLRDIAENIEKHNRKIIQVRSNHNSDNAKYMAKWGQYKLKGGENYREMLFKIPGSSYSNTAMDVHWGEREGVLAHARIQDLNTFLGKMLFVEEIQSDWHNEGHKSGYESDAAAILEKIKDLKQQWHSLYNEMLEARGEEARAISEKMDAIDTERARLAKKVRFGDLVPDAPFKDNYHEYVLKRLIREAAEQDYDSIGWTTKEVQMQRWNPNRKTNAEMGIESKNPDAVAFEEGYRIEYDQDIRNFMDKFGKKWGTRVGKTTLDNGTEVWSMAITDSMKESVLTEGQALYSDRDSNDSQLTEDQVEYFEKSQARNRNGKLQVVYHGGTVEFEFDTTRGGKGSTQYGPGAYFTDSEYYAKEYTYYRGGDVKAYYLNIEKMFDDTNMDATVQMHQWKKLEQILRSNGIEDKFINKFKEGGFAYMSRYLALKAEGGAKTSGSWEGSEQLNAMLREAGFDGIKGELNDCYQYVIFTPNQAKLTTNEVPSSFYDTRYQDRDDDSVSNRSLLANAFEGLAKDDTERNKIREYKEHIALINEEEKKLRKLNEQIKELSFAKGPRDTKKIKALRFDAVQAANRINTYDKQLLRLEASKPLQNVLNREKKLAYKKAEERGKEALAAYKTRVEAKQKETTEQWRKSRKAAVAKARETAEKRDARAKLQKLVLDTVNWISYPTKTDVKCPDILKKPYADFLNGIDLSSKRQANGGDPTKNDLRLANAMGSLATALDKIMTAQDPTQETEKVLDTGYLDLPVNFVQQLRDMTENIKAMMVEGDYVVNSMTAAEVRQLSQMIRTLNHAIKTMSNLYANLRFANVEALGVDTMDFMDALGEIEKTGGVKDFVEWDNALPYYAFKRFGKGGESVFEGLMDAQDKLAFLAQAIFDFQEKTWTGEEAKAWSEDTHTITLPNGNELTLTTADAMSIYCLSRREQGLQHLLGGGTRVMGIKKGAKKAKDSRSILTIEDISAINSSLTDRQKQVADGIQQFMSTVCSEWGNEISMKRFLTKEFTEKFYFPIESNDENLPTKDPAAQQSDLFRLLNISATKPLTPGANNEVIIRNIFDVFTGHASDMARLNAYGMALLDYMKWLNYREKTANEQGQINVRGVRKSMELAYGNAAKSYVLNLVKDVNGRPSDGGDPNILMKWMRAAKTASVGSSLRVATLQITSYPRAALVLSPKSLTLGLSKLPQIEKAKKYCGIALWKSFGFYDTNISRSIEDQMKGVKDVKQKLIELSLKGAEWGDAITWGALWNACEYEVAQTTKNKVGTEEFYQEVGKKLREVVYRTQVVDSTLTRSQIMRSKRGMAQEAAAFMSEPTLSANILMDAGFEFNAEKRRTGSAKAAWNKTGKYIGRAVAVYAIGQLTAALLEGLWDAWRDEEDEEFGKKYLNAFVENLVLDLAPFNKLPIVSDVFEAALAMFNVGFYSSDKMSTTWLTQAVSAVDTWKDALSGNSSVTVYNALYKSVRAISSFFGVSASGVMREAVALWNNTAGAYDATLKVLTYDRSQEELGEMLLDAFVKGNDRRANSLKAEFKDEEDSEKAIRKAVKKRYEAGDINADTATKYLVEYGGLDADDAYWKTQEWSYETESGEDFQKYDNFYVAVKTGKNLKAVIKEYTDNGVESKTLASQITSYFKPLYKEMTKTERASIKGYLLNAYELLGYDRSQKSKDIDKWAED